MIPYMPQRTLEECVQFLITPHLYMTAINACDVLMVIHEDASRMEPAILKKLAEHPSVEQWRPHAAYLASYGLSLIDRISILKGETPAHAKAVESNLSRQLDLATTDDYSMDPPPWLGNKHFHDSHLSHFITHYPSLYEPFIGVVPFGLTLQFP